jgi:colicin import membrane protein
LHVPELPDSGLRAGVKGKKRLVYRPWRKHMMPIRRLPLALSSVISLVVPLLLLAACQSTGTPTPAAAPEQPQTLEQASAQRQRAEAMREAAEARWREEQRECYKKFLVSSCLVDAKKRYTQADIEARNVDLPAREFERQARRQELDLQDAKRAAEQPVREAEQKAQAEKYRQDEARKAAERERKRLEKNQQAEAGRQKTAAEQAQRQAQEAERATKDAERAARKANAEAKADAEAAARVPKP